MRVSKLNGKTTVCHTPCATRPPNDAVTVLNARPRLVPCRCFTAEVKNANGKHDRIFSVRHPSFVAALQCANGGGVGDRAVS